MRASIRTVLLLAGTAGAAFGQDVIRPGDPITPSSFNSPAGEAVAFAIDNAGSTKYLNFDRVNTGFTVTPSGAGVVRGISIVTANDAPERDPTSFILEGSDDGVSFTVIASGPLSPPTTRFSLASASFANNAVYANYRVTFPTTRSTAANSMQVAEVQLITRADISTPSDTITVTFPPGGSSPAGEGVTNLLDNRLDRKFDVINAGGGPTIVDLTPAAGATVISGVTFYGASDDAGFPGRTPQSVTIEGSNDGTNYTRLFRDALTPNGPNFADQSVSFENAVGYTRYRFTFEVPFGGGDMQLGEIELHGTIGVGAPANDSCASAAVIGPGVTVGSNVNATSDGATSCDAGAALDVWYSFTPELSGPVVVSTCGSSLDTVLGVFGACGAPEPTCANNSCGAGSIVEFYGTAGHAYLIRVAGVNGATGAFAINVDPFPVPHDDSAITLPYNFNGIVHAGEAGLPDAPNGYRSISDRGLRFTGQPGSLEVGLLGTTGMPYQVVTTANTVDIVHIGNRDSVDNFNHSFDIDENGDDTGVRPAWLADPAQDGPHTADLHFGRLFRMGEDTRIGVLYHVSNGGGTFDATLSFYDGSTATVTLQAPDWFGDQNPQPAGFGVAVQTQLGVFEGADSVDRGNDGVPLNVIEAIITTGSLRDGGLGEFAGKRLASISFGNRTNFSAGYAIFATTIRDPGCPADFDGSGGVDSDDTIAFFAEWDSGGNEADYNGDGGVDSDDVIEFFGRWDAGC